ncbi:MAG: hypothetical protein IJT72_03750 [Lachnospiraceae bacterium]|nr:hypothetical protein [Lachnospiraceae bacterium]
MFLAISGSKLFVLYLAVIFIIVFVFVRRFLKKNSNAKRKREDKYNELSTFILQYEASKKVGADKGNTAKQNKDNKTEAGTKEEEIKEEIKEDKCSETELDSETTARIKALYFDAEMSVDKISEKTGISIEHIESVVKN